MHTEEVTAVRGCIREQPTRVLNGSLQIEPFATMHCCPSKSSSAPAHTQKPNQGFD